MEETDFDKWLQAEDETKRKERAVEIAREKGIIIDRKPKKKDPHDPNAKPGEPGYRRKIL